MTFVFERLTFGGKRKRKINTKKRKGVKKRNTEKKVKK
jgi:hypothetical protein